MHSTSPDPGDTDVTEHEDTGLVDYLPLAILVYAAVGLVVSTARLDSADVFGLGHLLGFLGNIVGWPLVLIGLV